MAVEPHQFLVKEAGRFGFASTNVGPASVDLMLHSKIKYAKKPSCFARMWSKITGAEIAIVWREVQLSHDDCYTFQPGYFYLCSTFEYVKVPTTHCAFVQMRSSLARKGLGHKMAGFIDPGFEGQVTLELSTDIPVRVHFAERVVQLIYTRLTEETTQPYSGKYQGQEGPTEAYTF